MKKMTQCEKVLDYIKRFGSITPLDAFADLGIMRLASRMNDLKNQDYQTRKVMEKSQNRFGEPVVYARYYIDNL